MIGIDETTVPTRRLVWAGYDEPDGDWARTPVEIRIRPAFGVSCSEHGVVGHAADYDEAKILRDRHWQDIHVPRIPNTGGDVHPNNPTN